MLKRERKRRLEAAEIYEGRRPRRAGRPGALRRGAHRRLPACRARRHAWRRSSTRRSPRWAPSSQRHGQGHGRGHEEGRGRADAAWSTGWCAAGLVPDEGPRRCRAGLLEGAMTRKTIQLGDNAEALALAGAHDANLKVLERELRCQVTLRGDKLRLAGDDAGVEQAARRGGRAAARAARRAAGRRGRRRSARRHRRERERQALRGLRRHRLESPGPPDRAAHDPSEAVRRRHPRQHDHLRDRPGRYRQDLPRRGRRGRSRSRTSVWAASSSPGRRSRRGRVSGSCRAPSQRRSTPTSGRCSTRCTT